VGLSRAHLSRLFHTQMGVSLGSFRQDQRMNRFLRLFGTSGRWNVLETALQAGFGSYPQFYKVFRASFGVSPGQYRRMLRTG
jgi:AraC-like DNA-binding protein